MLDRYGGTKPPSSSNYNQSHPVCSNSLESRAGRWVHLLSSQNELRSGGWSLVSLEALAMPSPLISSKKQWPSVKHNRDVTCRSPQSQEHALVHDYPLETTIPVNQLEKHNFCKSQQHFLEFPNPLDFSPSLSLLRSPQVPPHSDGCLPAALAGPGSSPKRSSSAHAGSPQMRSMVAGEKHHGNQQNHPEKNPFLGCKTNNMWEINEVLITGRINKRRFWTN